MNVISKTSREIDVPTSTLSFISADKAPPRPDETFINSLLLGSVRNHLLVEASPISPPLPIDGYTPPSWFQPRKNSKHETQDLTPVNTNYDARGSHILTALPPPQFNSNSHIYQLPAVDAESKIKASSISPPPLIPPRSPPLRRTLALPASPRHRDNHHGSWEKIVEELRQSHDDHKSNSDETNHHIVEETLRQEKKTEALVTSEELYESSVEYESVEAVSIVHSSPHTLSSTIPEDVRRITGGSRTYLRIKTFTSPQAFFTPFVLSPIRRQGQVVHTTDLSPGDLPKGRKTRKAKQRTRIEIPIPPVITLKSNPLPPQLDLHMSSTSASTSLTGVERETGEETKNRATYTQTQAQSHAPTPQRQAYPRTESTLRFSGEYAPKNEKSGVCEGFVYGYGYNYDSYQDREDTRDPLEESYSVFTPEIPSFHRQCSPLSSTLRKAGENPKRWEKDETGRSTVYKF